MIKAKLLLLSCIFCKLNEYGDVYVMVNNFRDRGRIKVAIRICTDRSDYRFFFSQFLTVPT